MAALLKFRLQNTSWGIFLNMQLLRQGTILLEDLFHIEMDGENSKSLCDIREKCGRLCLKSISFETIVECNCTISRHMFPGISFDYVCMCGSGQLNKRHQNRYHIPACVIE